MHLLLIGSACLNAVTACIAAHNVRQLRRLRTNVAGYAVMLRAGYLAQFDRPEA